MTLAAGAGAGAAGPGAGEGVGPGPGATGAGAGAGAAQPAKIKLLTNTIINGINKNLLTIFFTPFFEMFSLLSFNKLPHLSPPLSLVDGQARCH